MVAKHDEVPKIRLQITQIDAQDSLQVLCETAASSVELTEQITANVRNLLRVRGEVVLQSVGSLPNDGKVIDDQREY